MLFLHLLYCQIVPIYFRRCLLFKSIFARFPAKSNQSWVAKNCIQRIDNPRFCQRVTRIAAAPFSLKFNCKIFLQICFQCCFLLSKNPVIQNLISCDFRYNTCSWYNRIGVVCLWFTGNWDLFEGLIFVRARITYLSYYFLVQTCWSQLISNDSLHFETKFKNSFEKISSGLIRHRIQILAAKMILGKHIIWKSFRLNDFCEIAKLCAFNFLNLFEHCVSLLLCRLLRINEAKLFSHSFSDCDWPERAPINQRSQHWPSTRLINPNFYWFINKRILYLFAFVCHFL